MDFLVLSYRLLLLAVKHYGYCFLCFSDYCINKDLIDVFFILRHDVEKNYTRALQFAQIEHSLGIQGSYYFRITRHYDEEIIKQIAVLGHEIGYHYDDLSACKGDRKKAIIRFQYNLEKLRQIAPVKTIVMEGAPRSRYDNKDLWQTHNYRDYGIIGEPYFDVNFDEVFYLTDTGRRWDGWQVSVRDKVPQQEQWRKDGLVYHKTKDIIIAIESGTFPRQVMITVHPQRWHSAFLPWCKELLMQNAKNVVKRIIVR